MYVRKTLSIYILMDGTHVQYMVGWFTKHIQTKKRRKLPKDKNKHTYNKLHLHKFNGPFSWSNRVSQYQKGKTNLDFTEARDSQ